jgi:hypothetical protein
MSFFPISFISVFSPGAMPFFRWYSVLGLYGRLSIFYFPRFTMGDEEKKSCLQISSLQFDGKMMWNAQKMAKSLKSLVWNFFRLQNTCCVGTTN